MQQFHTINLHTRPTHLLARRFPFLLDPRPAPQHRSRAPTPPTPPFLQRVPHIFTDKWYVWRSQAGDNDSARCACHNTWRHLTHERAYSDRAPITLSAAEYILVRGDPTHRAATVGQSVCRLGSAVGSGEYHSMGHIPTSRVGVGL